MQATIFSGVTVIPMDTERVLADRDVLVKDGRVAAIGPGGTIDPPAGARVVDAGGRFLLPGLADMHVHLAYDEGDQAAALELFAANGVTTVLNLQGMPSHLRLRERIAAGDLLAPALYTSGPYISNAPYYSPTPDEAAGAVRDQKAAGYDVVKIHGDFSLDAYRSVMRAARAEGLKVVGHAPRNIGMEPVFAEGQDALAHVEEYIYAHYRFGREGRGLPEGIEALTDRIVSRTRAAGVHVIANLTAYHGIWKQAVDVRPLLARPEMAFVPAGIRHNWEPERNTYVRRFGGSPRPFEEWYGVLQSLVADLDRAGVPLMAGSDAPIPCVIPGFSLHDELQDLVAAGLTPYRALRAATVTPAKFLGAEEAFGTVRVGGRADLVLVADNPLEDVRAVAKPLGVMLRGRWLDRDALDARLAALAAYASAPASNR
jgi:imidazolonepropionase-like amidohydrolase